MHADMVSGRASAARIPILTFAYGETEAQNIITVQQLTNLCSAHTNDQEGHRIIWDHLKKKNSPFALVVFSNLSFLHLAKFSAKVGTSVQISLL